MRQSFFIILLQLAMSEFVERVKAVSTHRRLNKFTFADYGFAEFVRGRMQAILVQFDTNENQLFEEDQIKSALVNILNEDPQQLHYVLQNVFRYDKDGDMKITHKQFIDFSVQQHFGEMAIQRLHRQKMYSQGSKRIMNVGQFMNTLEYSLNTIEVHGSEQIYQHLFNQIDLDRDGYISYEDYFIFLKEYFGSLNQIPPNPQPRRPDPSPRDPDIDNRATERFAKLIYSQLKITVMQIDTSRKMNFGKPQIRRFLSEILQMVQGDMQYVTGLILKDQNSISYDQFLHFIVPFYFCQYFLSVSGIGGQQINIQFFVQLVSKASAGIVAVPPSEKTLVSIFYLAAGATNMLTIEQFVMLMENIFENYSFDKRGISRGIAY